MPQQAWTEKRERQYEKIKKGLLERGEDADRAEEIAARTVNKGRARSGEAEGPSELSRRDISSGRRGGLRSHRGARGRTKAQLYEEAKDMGIDGRSQMNKDELREAVDASEVRNAQAAGPVATATARARSSRLSPCRSAAVKPPHTP